MDFTNIFVLDNYDSVNMGKTLIVMSDSMYNNIVDSVNLNYLLIIFTIGCFTSILCGIRNDKEYRLIKNSDTVNAEIIEVNGTHVNKIYV